MDASRPADDAGATAPLGSVRLRSFRVSDLEAAQALSAELRWPHRLEDWRFALAFGAGVVAERDGAIVGTALRWFWGADRATLGLVLVATAFRGHGIGRRLMTALLQDTGRRNVLLHTTAQGQPLCEQLGFRKVGEIRQHQGIAVAVPWPVLREGERLRLPERADADLLAQIDLKSAGLSRRSVIRRLLDYEHVAVLERGGRVSGFSVLRRFASGHAIGPVAAPDMASARALIAYWCHLYAGKFLRIDVDAQSGLSEWLDSHGLRQAGVANTMARGTPPPCGPARGSWALLMQGMG